MRVRVSLRRNETNARSRSEDGRNSTSPSSRALRPCAIVQETPHKEITAPSDRSGLARSIDARRCAIQSA